MMVRIPGRRRRRAPTAVLAGLMITGLVVAGLAVVGLSAWWRHRGDDASHVVGQTPEEAAFDATALDRAAGEGMAPVHALEADDAPVESNGAGRVPVAGGGLVRLV